jgi:hypothetical protein
MLRKVSDISWLIVSENELSRAEPYFVILVNGYMVDVIVWM